MLDCFHKVKNRCIPWIWQPSEAWSLSQICNPTTEQRPQWPSHKHESLVNQNYPTSISKVALQFLAGDSSGLLVYNSPPPPFLRVMTFSIEDCDERRSHTNFGDDVATTSSDTACQNLRPIRYDRIECFSIWSFPVFEKWYPCLIQILFWLKSYCPYPKTIQKCTMMHNIHFCVVFVLPWGKITVAVILPLAEHNWLK